MHRDDRILLDGVAASLFFVAGNLCWAAVSSHNLYLAGVATVVFIGAAAVTLVLRAET